MCEGWLYVGSIEGKFSRLRSFLFGSKRRSLFGVWLILVVLPLLVQIIAGGVNNRVTNISVFLCAFSTLLFWSFRAPLTSFVSRWGALVRSGASSCSGLLRGSWITGVAANPNLAIDLLATMPWYVLMIALLWRVQTTYRYTSSSCCSSGASTNWARTAFSAPCFTDGLLGNFATGRVNHTSLRYDLFVHDIVRQLHAQDRGAEEGAEGA